MIQNEVPESLILDYKAADALAPTDGKKAEPSKDVSAFANSAGGTLIYGVKEKKDYLPDDIDPYDRGGKITGEWIEQVINSKIQPRVAGVRIKALDVPSKGTGKIIFVVHVPQSNTAHMAAGNKYYKRYNFVSIPMEDYEVRDVMSRALETSNLFLHLDVFPYDSRIHLDVWPVRFQIENRSEKPAEYCFVEIKVEKDRLPSIEERRSQDLGVIHWERQVLEACVFKEYWPSSRTPIWKGVMQEVTTLLVKPGRSLIEWMISAPQTRNSSIVLVNCDTGDTTPTCRTLSVNGENSLEE